MAKLIYSANASLDGYVEDERGSIEWATPDDEVFRFVNDYQATWITPAVDQLLFLGLVVDQSALALAKDSRSDTVRRRGRVPGPAGRAACPRDCESGA